MRADEQRWTNEGFDGINEKAERKKSRRRMKRKKKKRVDSRQKEGKAPS